MQFNQACFADSTFPVLLFFIGLTDLKRMSGKHEDREGKNEVQQRKIARVDKTQRNGDKHLLGLKSKSDDPSSQRGRGRGACVGVCAF